MRRHGFPFTVIPRHVEAGFRESERGRTDSGVLANCGMPTVECEVVFKIFPIKQRSSIVPVEYENTKKYV